MVGQLSFERTCLHIKCFGKRSTGSHTSCPVNIEKILKKFNTHRCAMDFDNAVRKATFTRSEWWSGRKYVQQYLSFSVTLVTHYLRIDRFYLMSYFFFTGATWGTLILQPAIGSMGSKSCQNSSYLLYVCFNNRKESRRWEFIWKICFPQCPDAL